MGVLVFDDYIVESIAPNPMDPDDVGGSAEVLSFRLGEKQRFELTLGAGIQEPVHVWDGDLRLSVIAESHGRVPSFTVTLSRPSETTTADPAKDLRLSSRDPQPLEGALHIRLERWAAPKDPDAIDLDIRYITHHAGQGPNATSSSSPVASDAIRLSANNKDWAWRDFLFEAKAWDDQGVDLKVARLSMEPFPLIATSGDVVTLAQQETWHTFLTAMLSGKLPDLQAITTKEAYDILVNHASSYDLPTHAFVEWGMAWEKMTPEWHNATETEATLHIGPSDKSSRFVLARDNESWKISEYHPGE